jgi:hypothetical protein
VEKDKEKALRIAKNLEKASAEDLVLLAKYSNNKKKMQRVQVFISSTIATMAGAAIVATYLFPELDKLNVIVGSSIVGVITVALSFWQRKKEESTLLRKLLNDSDNPTPEDIKEAEAFRAEMISALKKEAE